MRTKFYFVAALAATMLASCADDTFVGDNSPNELQENAGVGINFGLNVPGRTRADIYGGEAAKLLGNNFYVMGTKGTGESDGEVEPNETPTKALVFDNYLVHYDVNTAGTTESNTANWEYVGVQPGTTGYDNYVYLTSNSRTAAPQTIKYWDYSTKSYDFFAFSTGGNKAVSNTVLTGTGALETGEIGVTNMNYGSALTSGTTAYTLYIPSVVDLKKTYITDIKKVLKANYGQEVQLQFKNIGAKVRVGLYETVPGYSVKNVKFYKVDAGATPSDLADVHETDAYLIGSSDGDEYSFPSKAQINVAFGHTGATNKSTQDYDIAKTTVIAVAKDNDFQSFGALNYTGKDPSGHEDDGDYLGRDLPNPTFAGSADAKYYQIVFPVSDSYPLTLRVDYTLVSTDGSDEEIKVYGAKAVVPATYTKWLPNYAYTYIFKICDNTNGWTDTEHTKAGLFPITFDAVVAETTDANAEQRTVTTVATPSITTYQQYHKTDANEYSIKVKDLKGNDAVRNIYVQVMDNSILPAKLIGSSSSSMPLLNTTTEEGTAASRLFDVTPSGTATISEATVMDALENRTTDIDADNVVGRNKITLTKVTDGINNEVQSIVNGVDNNPITKIEGADIAKGQVAMIDVSKLTANHTYAYVYDYTGASTEKVLTTVWQPVATETGTTVVTSYYYISVSNLTTAYATLANRTSGSEAAAKDYLYFSVTTNGGSTPKVSFVSVDDKIGQTLPAGLLKVSKDDLTEETTSGAKAAADTFYFTTYTRNDGKYAVKVIKVVSGS